MHARCCLIGLGVFLLVVRTGVPDETPREKPASLAHMVSLPDDLKWVDAPPGLPPGAKLAVLAGDPGKAGGTFTIRAKMPDGYTVPPHWHAGDENVTVLEGSLGMGMGDSLDKSKVRYLPVGGFVRMPKGERHFAIAKGATIIQVHGTSPFDITYVNEKDDPRKKGEK